MIYRKITLTPLGKMVSMISINVLIYCYNQLISIKKESQQRLLQLAASTNICDYACDDDDDI